MAKLAKICCAMEAPNDPAAEIEGIKAIFGDDVTLDGEFVVRIHAKDVSVVLVITKTIGYPKELPAIDVEGDVSSFHRNEFLNLMVAKKEELLKKVGQPCLFDIAETFLRWTEETPDLTSDLSSDDQKFLRSSASGREKKKETTAVPEARTAAMLRASATLQLSASSSSASSGKKKSSNQNSNNQQEEEKKVLAPPKSLCHVCGVQLQGKSFLIKNFAYCKAHRCSVCDVALAKPISVGQVSFCAQHASSSSQRHVPLSGEEDVGVTLQDRARAFDQLFRLLVSMCEKGSISVVDLDAVFALISCAPSMLKLPAATQEDIQRLVKATKVPETFHVSLESLTDCEKLIESMSERCGILPSHIKWIKSYFSHVVKGFHAEDAEGKEEAFSSVDELRILAETFKSTFVLRNPDYLDKVEGIVTSCRVLLEANQLPDVNVEVIFKYFDDESGKLPLLEVGESQGLTTGDLVYLEQLLSFNLAAFDQGKSFSSMSRVQMVLSFLNELVAASIKAPYESELVYPFVPKSGFRLEPVRPSANETFTSMNMKELDQTMMKALQDAIDATKVKVYIRGRNKSRKGDKKVKKVRTKPLFEVVHVENVVSSKTFDAFLDCSKKMFEDVNKSPVFPVVAWHGTPSSTNVESIVRNGILGEGEMTDTGFVINVSHGSLYGHGIYLSPNLEVSDWYSKIDAAGNGQCFFSIVLLGNPRFLTWNELEVKDTWYNLCQQPAGMSKLNNDSHVTPDKSIYVVFDSCQVLPFFLVTYCRAGSGNQPGIRNFTGLSAFGETRVAAVQSISDIVPAKQEKKLRAAARRKKERQDKNNPKGEDKVARQRRVLVLKKIPTAKGMHFMVRVPGVYDEHEYWTGKNNFAASSLRLIFIVDKSASMGSSFKNVVMPACKHLFRSLKPSACQVVLFGSNVDFYGTDKVTSPAFFDALDVKLENATNFVGGVERAAQVALRDQEILLKEGKPKPLFLFAIMSDGQDTVNSTQATDEKFSMLSKMFAGSTTSSMVRAINIGKKADTSLAMKAKMYLETSYSYEESPMIYVRSRGELPKLMQVLSAELEHALLESCSSVVIASSAPVTMEGFVSNLLRPPVPKMEVLAADGETTPVLFSGVPPRTMELRSYFCGEVVDVHVDNSLEWLDNLEEQNALLLLLRSKVDDIAVAAIAGFDVSAAVTEIRHILDSLTEAAFSEAMVAHKTAEERRKLMKTKKLLVEELRNLMNRVSETLVMKTATSDDQAVWLTRADKLKYGLKALRRQKTKLSVTTIQKQLCALAANNSWLRLTSDMVSSVSGLTSIGHFSEMANALACNSLIDMLYSYGAVGLGARVRRSAASAIDPWQLQVEYISSDPLDTGSAMCFLQAGIAHKDKNGERCTDVVLLGDPRNFEPYAAYSKTGLFQAYSSIVFSTNPDLYTPKQVTALLCHALCRSVTQLMSAPLRSEGSVLQMLHLLYTVRKRMTRGDDGDSYWGNLVTKLSQPDHAQHLTEAPEDDVGSINKVLACLLCLPERAPFLKDIKHMSDLSLALLAEASSRGCRVEVKIKGNDAHPLLLKALGIKEDSCLNPTPLNEPNLVHPVHSDAFDLAEAKKASSKFFRRELAMSTCPPTSVVAVLSLCKFLGERDNNMLMRLLEDGTTNQVVDGIIAVMSQASMASFISTWVNVDKRPPLNPTLLQVALYVQGLRYHSSAERRLGVPSLRDPQKVLQELARFTREERYFRLLGQKLKILREQNNLNAKALRLEAALIRQQEFMRTHGGVPRIYTALEAEELGIEISYNGLPLYVCSHVDCPLYLKQLHPQGQVASRKYLYKHLSPLLHPERQYIKSLHVDAMGVIRQNKNISFESFVEKLHLDLFPGSRQFSVQLYKDCLRVYAKRQIGEEMEVLLKGKPKDWERHAEDISKHYDDAKQKKKK